MVIKTVPEGTRLIFLPPEYDGYETIIDFGEGIEAPELLAYL